MKYRIGLIALGFVCTLVAEGQDVTVEKLSAVSNATKINRPAVTEALARERIRLTNPTEREAFLANTTTQLEQSKQHLFATLGKAAPDKLAQLKNVMAEALLSMHLANLSDQAEGGNDLGKGTGFSLALVQAETELKIHELLGDDGYSVYLAYQQSEPYRSLIHLLANSMRANGSAITPDQEQLLLDRYVAARLKAAEVSVKEAGPQVVAGLTLTERRALGQVELCTIASVIGGRQNQRFESYLAEAISGVLSPSDVKLFFKIRSEQDTRPDWRSFVPSEFPTPQ